MMSLIINYLLFLLVDMQGAIIFLDFIFIIHGPGFPCHLNPEETPPPREDGYVNFPDHDASSGNYEPPAP